MDGDEKEKSCEEAPACHSEPPFTFSKTGQGPALKGSFWLVASLGSDVVFQNSTAFSC